MPNRQGNFKFKKLLFITKPEVGDYASCFGLYEFREGEVYKGEPVFFTADKPRILIKSGNGWVITSKDYYANIKKEQPDCIGGFHGADGKLDLFLSEWHPYDINFLEHSIPDMNFGPHPNSFK